MRSDDEDDPFFKKKEKKGQMMVLQKVLLRVQAPDIQKFSAEEKRMVKGGYPTLQLTHSCKFYKNLTHLILLFDII